MSFDIHMTCFRAGKPADFPRRIFEELFLPFCDGPEFYRQDPGFMRVRFSDGGADIYLSNQYSVFHGAIESGLLPKDSDIGIDDKSVVGNFMFNHCGGDMFYQAMYELADRSGSVIYWPALRPSTVVTREAVLKDVPQESFDHATIRIVHSGRDIFKEIGASFGDK